MELLLVEYRGHRVLVLGPQVLGVVERVRLLLRWHRREYSIVEAEAHAVVAKELGTCLMLLLEELSPSRRVTFFFLGRFFAFSMEIAMAPLPPDAAGDDVDEDKLDA